MKRSIGEKIRNQSNKSLCIELLVVTMLSFFLMIGTVFYIKLNLSVNNFQLIIFIVWMVSILYAYVYAIKRFFKDKILTSNSIVSIISIIIVPAIIAPILMIIYIKESIQKFNK